MSETDRQLLERYMADESGEAFRALVDRHLPLVHSVARRVTANEEAARDVSQTIFTKLAQRASRIPADLPLTAWLHRETHSASVNHVRSEVRRQAREKTAVSLESMKNDQQLWSDLTPVIDGAIDDLSAEERSLILLRFYEEKSHREIGVELGIKEDAARMRTNRAMEKLRGILSKRGITTTAAVLAVTLPAHALTAPPVSLAASISATATAAATGTAAATVGTTSAVGTALALAKANLVGIAAIAVAVPVIALQQGEISKLKDDVKSLHASGTTAALGEHAPASKKGIRPRRSGAGGGASLQDLLAETDPMARIQALLAYAARIDTADILAAVEELRRGSPEWDPDANMLARMLLTRWAQEDPDGAIATLNGLDLKSRSSDVSAILASLAATDPKRAAEWLGDPESSLMLQPWMGQVLAGTIAKEWVRQDPDGALAWAESLSDSKRSGAYAGVLGSLAATDPARAGNLAQTLEAGEARSYVLGEIARTWARTEPNRAVEWAQSLEAAEQARAVESALWTWTQSAPADAAQWVTLQDEGAGKENAMGTVMWTWTTRDPDGAAAWLGEQPAGPARDAGIGGLARAAFEFDPAGAVEWTTVVSNEELRTEYLEAGLREWVRRDREAAVQWATENDVSLPADSSTPSTTR